MIIKQKSSSKLLLLTSVVFLALSGCGNYATKQEMGKDIGTALGAAAGIGIAVITGSDDGIDHGTVLGAGIGAMIGSAIGSAIGENMDETDRLKAELATLTALKADDSRTVTWKSPKNDGVGGEVTVVNQNSNANSNCKVINHLININGKEHREEQEYCLGESGSWVLQS